MPGGCTPYGGDCASVTGIVVPEVAGTSAFVVVLVVVVVVVMVDVVVIGSGVRALSGRGQTSGPQGDAEADAGDCRQQPLHPRRKIANKSILS